MLLKYPEIIQVLPMLIAERMKNSKIDLLDPEIEDFIAYEFDKKEISREEAGKYLYFSERVGILDLLIEVKDLYDYLIGVEVGIDTNARKNRSGEIFERLVYASLKRRLPSHIELIPQDSNFSLYRSIGKSPGEQAKRHDFVLYIDNKPKFILEANFYNTTGSKPISVAESYITLQREAKKLGIKFAWITDGKAWAMMKEPLLRAMREIDYVLNFKMIPRFCSYLEKIFKST